MFPILPQFYLEPEHAPRFPVLHGLIRELDAAAGRNIESLLDPFQALMRSRELDVIAGEALQRSYDDETTQSTWLATIAEHWTVVETDAFTLRVLVLKPERTGILSSLAFDCLVGNLGRNPLHLVRHGFPPGARPEVFDRDARLGETRSETLEQGQSCVLIASRDVPEYRLTKSVLQLQLHAKRYAPLVWMFAKDTGVAQMVSASSDKPVRYQAIADIMQHVLRDPALPAEASLQTLAGFLQHDFHYIRWSALRSMCAIDFEFAQPYLLEACRDPHPAVAAAAKSAVQQHLTTSS